MRVLNFNTLSRTTGPAAFADMSSFGALSNEFLEFLLRTGEILEFTDGEQIFSAGERANCFYIVLEGGVQLYAGEHLDGRPIAFVNVGQSFGFASLIGLRHRSYAARCDRYCIVLQISSGMFASLYEKNEKEFPVFFINLSRDMSRFLAHLADKPP